MKINKKGFTLTEILLAVVIVGLIGVALAALTTSASREASSGKSRVALRNNLSQFVRKLRNDVQSSSRVLYAAGLVSDSDTVNKKAVLVLGKNMDLSGNAIASQTRQYIVYCFKRGTTTTLPNTAKVQPANKAWDGGTIYRGEVSYSAWTNSSANNICSTVNTAALTNVKLITDNQYRVPYFNVKRKDATAPDANGHVSYDSADRTSAYDAAGQSLVSGNIVVRLIVELPSTPIINEVIEEELWLPIGLWDVGYGSRGSYDPSTYN